MKALVTGGTGCVGSALVERLLENGFEVRALARKSSNLHHLKTTGAQIVFGDVRTMRARAAADGVDIVFHAAPR
jgi:dihydroflavonol-4-reductase